jgi:hypothetical protein
MQQDDEGLREKNGGRKRDQLSQTSSSREKRQINSRRIELPIIIGPQHFTDEIPTELPYLVDLAVLNISINELMGLTP